MINHRRNCKVLIMTGSWEKRDCLNVYINFVKTTIEGDIAVSMNRSM